MEQQHQGGQTQRHPVATPAPPHDSGDDEVEAQQNPATSPTTARKRQQQSQDPEESSPPQLQRRRAASTTKIIRHLVLPVARLFLPISMARRKPEYWEGVCSTVEPEAERVQLVTFLQNDNFEHAYMLAVRLAEESILVELSRKVSQSRKQSALERACLDKNVAIVDFLLGNELDHLDTYTKNWSLITCVKGGNAALVSTMIEHATSDFKDQALVTAAESNIPELFPIIIPNCNQEAIDRAFRNAVALHHFATSDHLREQTTVEGRDLALQEASAEGDVSAVRHLMEFTSANGQVRAVETAAATNQSKVLDVLLYERNRLNHNPLTAEAVQEAKCSALSVAAGYSSLSVVEGLTRPAGGPRDALDAAVIHTALHEAIRRQQMVTAQELLKLVDATAIDQVFEYACRQSNAAPDMLALIWSATILTPSPDSVDRALCSLAYLGAHSAMQLLLSKAHHSQEGAEHALAIAADLTSVVVDVASDSSGDEAGNDGGSSTRQSDRSSLASGGGSMSSQEKRVHGRAECTKLLLPHVSSRGMDAALLATARRFSPSPVANAQLLSLLAGSSSAGQETAWIEAARNGYHVFLERANDAMELNGELVLLALLVATRAGKLSTIKFLLTTCVPNSGVTAPEMDGVLSQAVLLNDLALVRALSSHASHQGRDAALCVSARLKLDQAAEYLVSVASRSAKDEALQEAVAAHSLGGVRLLVSAASSSARELAMAKAVKMNHQDTVGVLMEAL